MLISIENGILNSNGFNSIYRNGYTYFYSGLIWMRNKKAGKETIKYIADLFEEKNDIPFIDIYGSFYCGILNPSGRLIFFTDNSNMHSFYIGQNVIGTNFLEVIKENNVKDFDEDALREFLKFGTTYFGKTLIKKVKLSESDKYYICENAEILIREKGIGGIEDRSSITDVNKFFEEMSYSLSELNLTLSLTGGYDSRMVFAALSKNIPINVFISGNNKKDTDIIYSQRVANAVGYDIDIIESQKAKVTEGYLNYLFKFAQGIEPYLNNGYIRINDFINNRVNKGFNCYLTGDGGVLHKDWWWMQDLPFYRKKTFDFNRFYSQRINFRNEIIPWGNALAIDENTIEESIVSELIKYKMPLNSQTYDSLYFNVNGKRLSINYSVHSSYINTYAPLWERELVKYSYNLPRRDRFFYNSIRKITTKASKDIARVPTNYGTTASSELPYLLRDILFQGVDYFKKACRLLGRKLLKRNLFVGNAVTWTVEDDVRALPISREALKYSIKNEILKEDTSLDSISFTLLGRLIQIYSISEYWKKKD
jgi:hypothetical protein